MKKYNVYELFDGEVGNVMNENEFNKKFGKFNGGEDICDIESFDFENSEIYLCKVDGYRGEGCYDGIVVKDGKSYFLDIVSEGVVCELEFFN